MSSLLTQETEGVVGKWVPCVCEKPRMVLLEEEPMPWHSSSPGTPGHHSSRLLRVSLEIHTLQQARQFFGLKYYVIFVITVVSPPLWDSLAPEFSSPAPHQIRYCNFIPTFWVICMFITESSLFQKAASKIHSQRLSWGSTQGTVLRMAVSMCVCVCTGAHSYKESSFEVREKELWSPTNSTEVVKCTTCVYLLMRDYSLWWGER